jgi:hypothetical protein
MFETPSFPQTWVITMAHVKVLGLPACAGVTNVCAQMPLPYFCYRSFAASCDLSVACFWTVSFVTFVHLSPWNSSARWADFH